MLDSIYLKEASVADLQKAVEALTRGQVPDPKQTKGLALHLNVTDVSKRVTDIKSVLGAGQKISGKSKAYRALRLNVFKEAWEAKWRKLIDEVRTRYPEGSPAPTRKVQKPKQTRKQAEQSQKQASTALDKTQEALDEAIVLEKEWRKKYGNFKRRKDPTDKEIAAMNAEGQKIFNKKTKAQKAVEDAEKRYEDSSERMFKHDAYDTESLEIEKVRAALEADRILGMISEGKTPKGKMVAGLFKQIDEAFEAARKAVKAEELLLDDLPNGLPIFSKEGPIKEAAYDYVKLLDNSTNSNKLLAQIDETSLARFDDLADDAIADFTEAGVPIKKATVAKDFEEMDTVEEAMKVCGNPKVEVVS